MILKLQLLSPHSTTTNFVNIISKLFAVSANGLFLVLIYYAFGAVCYSSSLHL